MFSRDGTYELDTERRIATGNRVNGALPALMGRRNVSTTARLAVHNAVLVSTQLYGSETWVLQRKNERKRLLLRKCDAFYSQVNKKLPTRLL